MSSHESSFFDAPGDPWHIPEPPTGGPSTPSPFTFGHQLPSDAYESTPRATRSVDTKTEDDSNSENVEADLSTSKSLYWPNVAHPASGSRTPPPPPRRLITPAWMTTRQLLSAGGYSISAATLHADQSHRPSDVDTLGRQAWPRTISGQGRTTFYLVGLCFWTRMWPKTARMPASTKICAS